MPTHPIKHLRTTINPATVKNVTKYLAQEATEDLAKEIMGEIKDIYKDKNGQSYTWRTKVYYTNRASRLYVTVACDNPEVRYKEARYGLIAKKIRSLTTKTPIQIVRQADGSYRLL